MSAVLSSATPERPVRLGRYDVTGLIRAGGMGTVYDAVDRDHGTRVALKTLTELDAENLLRFKTEFRAVADVSHPNLVPLYELSCEQGVWFFTMERIDGVEFIEHLRGKTAGDAPTKEDETTEHATTRRRNASYVHHPAREPTPSMPDSLPRLRGAFAELVRGVRALHDAGLLHLDLKPSNVLVDRSGRVVILDFGLVRAMHDAPSRVAPLDGENLTISGTPAWMAPEQFAGEGIGAPADWYAVGLMLYRALTGVPAFPVASVAVTWFAKVHLPPTPPNELLPDVPADLSALALDLLHPDPAQRPDGEAVARILSGDPGGRVSERPARSRLVGRRRERAALEAAVDLARLGNAALIHLTGPSGAGKSALLQNLRMEARAHGDVLVLRGRCYERESVPYKAFDGMLDELAARLSILRDEDVERDLPEWIAELCRVFPVLGSVPAIAARFPGAMAAVDALSVIELRRRALAAARELFTRLAARRLVILEIDDLQWADDDSTSLLLELLAEPAPKGLLIAASFRADEAVLSAALAPYFAAVANVRSRKDVTLTALDIGPLDRADSERLASVTLAASAVSPARLASAIADEAGGVPFFVEELAYFAVQQHEAGREISTSGITLDGLLAQRVAALPPGERSLVEVLAIANSPIPLSIAFSVAGIETGVLRALWSLRGGHFVRATGAGPEDRVELHHDRMRESVAKAMTKERTDQFRLALGRALAQRGTDSPWLFDAVRHLIGVADQLAPAERVPVARLCLAAGLRARRAAAFPLAFECYRAATRLLEPAAWETDYALALAIFGGAAEAAYLSASWTELPALVAVVKSRGRTILDQLVAWEVQIDAHIARNQYAAAVSIALEALRLLHVELPDEPGEAEVGKELSAAMTALAGVGPEGFVALPLATDPEVLAAMRIESRISSAAYFAKPMLLPVLACRLITTSVERGLSPATPHALSVYGIVLNSIGMLREAHAWGTVALSLLERFDDKSHETRTRHIVHDLVCVWTVPLSSTLDELRKVVDTGKAHGDLEYAAYAAHAYVHNAFYAARPLGPLAEAAHEYGLLMRSYQQVNALHVHTPFERLLACFTGGSKDPERLDGGDFTESAALATARSSGSRSAQCIVPLLMGIVRYHFGSVAEASARFESARPFLDGVASTWHVPIFHQYAALAIAALPEAERSALAKEGAASLAALRALAEHGPANFAHRVTMVVAETARAAGDLDAAVDGFGRAIAEATAGGWLNDLGLAHELAAECESARGRTVEAGLHRDAARAAYVSWGATAKADRLGAG